MSDTTKTSFVPRITGFSAEEWVKHMNQPYTASESLNAGPTTGIQAPANAFGVGDYDLEAKKHATSSSNPQSVFEGMQTIANLARVRAGYNPLDPEGYGDLPHFLQFTKNISDAPFLALLTADTKKVVQKSRDSNAIIDSFVQDFVGIAEQNQKEIENAVSSLAKAATSRAGAVQKYSNFAQNLLQVNAHGDIEFSVYNSLFEIKTKKGKGTITYHMQYDLSRAVYQLSQEAWDSVKDQFDQILKTTTDEWLGSMTTEVKPGPVADLSCL